MKIIRVKHTDINNYNLFTCFGGKTLYRLESNATEEDGMRQCISEADRETTMTQFRLLCVCVYWFRSYGMMFYSVRDTNTEH